MLELPGNMLRWQTCATNTTVFAGVCCACADWSVTRGRGVIASCSRTYLERNKFDAFTMGRPSLNHKSALR